jgi:hypothetical protein
MTLSNIDFYGAAIVGIGATMSMDIWALFVRRIFRVASANYCLVGRWFCHMPAGQFVHQSIAKSEPKRGECAVGWFAHYLIGLLYGVVLIVLTAGDWLRHPSLAIALVFGLLTLVFPFFVMQPSFGLGFASARSPNPAQARWKSLMNHTVFGMGLYISAVPVSYLATVA